MEITDVMSDTDELNGILEHRPLRW